MALDILCLDVYVYSHLPTHAYRCEKRQISLGGVQIWKQCDHKIWMCRMFLHPRHDRRNYYQFRISYLQRDQRWESADHKSYTPRTPRTPRTPAKRSVSADKGSQAGNKIISAFRA